MNVLFPVNGLGNRFKQEGYSQPKPLIKVGGEPMIVKVLKSFDFKKEDHIFIAYHRDLEAYSFERVIKLYLPELEERIQDLESKVELIFGNSDGFANDSTNDANSSSGPNSICSRGSRAHAIGRRRSAICRCCPGCPHGPWRLPAYR